MHLTDIDQLTKKYADAHTVLSDIVGALNETIERIKRDALPAIKKAVASAAERRAHLETAIDGNRDLFTQPRSLVLHGIKVGLRKQKGGITWENEKRVVELIEKVFGEDARHYLHITKAPDKEAINGLPAMKLRQIGVEILADQDKVLIKPADSDIEKIVNALLKDATITEP